MSPTPPRPDSPKPGIDDLRREIDAIDRGIQDLLERRAQVVGQIGEAKKGGGDTAPSGAMRPGREALIIRRLAERHNGVLPLDVLTGLWRGIISAFLRLQYPFTVYVASNQTSLFDVARIHFGPATPLKVCDPTGVIARVESDEFAVGVLPVAGEGSSWWTGLGTAEGQPRVVGLLPFVASENSGPQAYVLARTAQEESGDDVTLIRLKGGDEALLDRLAKAAKAEIIATRAADAHKTSRLDALLAAPGFITTADARFAAWQAEAAKAGAALDIIGGYAAPLRLKHDTL